MIGVCTVLSAPFFNRIYIELVVANTLMMRATMVSNYIHYWLMFVCR